jgi:hypothetical protein
MIEIAKDSSQTKYQKINVTNDWTEAISSWCKILWVKMDSFGGWVLLRIVMTH